MTTTLDMFTPAARETLVRAAQLAAAEGHSLIGPEFVLLALAEVRPLAGRPDGLGVTPAALHEQIRREQIKRDRGPRAQGDGVLLATLGIDAADVLRRASAATGVRPGDPALWSLSRSRIRPLRLTLDGPALRLRLTGESRKAIEVAAWSARRARRPLADREDLLWGLLADGSSPVVRVLAGLPVSIRALGDDLRTWHGSLPRRGRPAA
jgi:ClpA/ClpB-like protein